MADDAGPQRYVLGDWGTTRLRLFLMEHDAVAATCEGPGIAELTASPITTPVGILGDLIAPWTGSGEPPLRVLLSGMAGSRDGLAEVPYSSLPLRRETWFRAAVTRHTPSMHISIAAGVHSGGGGNSPDVMRGEETQIFGAMDLHHRLCQASQLVVLPGTHSKWVELEDGAITRFRTAMTGELFALLCKHSTLLQLHSAADRAGATSERDEATGFEAGVLRGAAPDGALLTAIFETRSAQLLEDRSPSWAAGFLSGLLIGREVATLSNLFHIAASICIIGDSGLAALYQKAFAARAMETHTLDGDECAVAGLQSLRRCLTRARV